jgi:hypothetical protein
VDDRSYAGRVPRTAILAVLVGAVVALVAAPGFVKLDEPNSDGLFYEVQRLQVEGDSEAEATRTVFDGAIARQTAAIEDEPAHPRVLDPAWVSTASASTGAAGWPRRRPPGWRRWSASTPGARCGSPL